MANRVFSGLVTDWRFAGCPTSRSPASVNATIDGVVRAPSVFSMTRTSLPSMTATQEFVVPRSMPITLLICHLSCGEPARPTWRREDPHWWSLANDLPRYLSRRVIYAGVFGGATGGVRALGASRCQRQGAEQRRSEADVAESAPGNRALLISTRRNRSLVAVNCGK